MSKEADKVEKFLRAELERMKAQPKEFEGQDPDDMFLAGYRVCIEDAVAQVERIYSD